ncbi:MAG: HAMP domain-containing histidine kinase [Sphingobacteriia bacterium]|nr:HAMP domain-containing histidine kinase [Sphingobacteriia bacterium]
MSNSLRTAVYKHGYLIITAAWLYTISFIFTNYWSYYSSPDKVKSKLEQRIHAEEKKINELSEDTALIKKLIRQSSPETNREIQAESFGVFIYKVHPSIAPQPLYWSTNKMEVPPNEMNRPTGAFFITNPHGSFIIHQKALVMGGAQYALFAVLPVQWTYFIQNKYFHTDFAAYPGLSDQYEISTAENAVAVNSSQGQYLFSIRLKEGKAFISYDKVTIALRVLSIVLLFFFLHLVAQELVIATTFSKGFVFLLLAVLLLRLVAYLLSFPFDFSKLPLFDPSIYASNFLHPSLGDLLINALLFYWLLLFYKIHLNRPTWLERRVPATAYASVAVFILTISCFVVISIIKSLVQDAKISFDVTNIFSLNIYSSVSFIILCLLALNFFYLSQILLRNVINQSRFDIQLYVMVVLSGFVCMLLFIERSDISLYLWVLAWLVVYLLILQLRKADLQKTLIRTPFFIFWVMIFALSIATLVMYENRVLEFEQRKRIAEKLAIQTDPSGENLLNIATTNFDTQFLQRNFYRFEAGEYSNKFLKDSLINQNFSGYLNKYDTRIYTFDSLFHPLYNDDSLNYASIKTIVLNQAKPTEVPDLYRYENSREGFSYIYQKLIGNETQVRGYLYVLMKSKRYKSEALYPELFNQSQDVLTDLNSNYAYAVYTNGKIINHFNNYNFPSRLNKSDVPEFEFSYRKAGDYTELWYNTGANRQVVIVKRSTWLIESVTLFAYMFLSFLVIILSFHIGNQLLNAKFNLEEIRNIFRLNIRSQIQATIIFVSVFSFIVIGIATISFFIYRFNSSNEERLSKSIQVMANELNARIKSMQAAGDIRHNPNVRYELEKVIAEVSDLHNVDINYYSAAGDLQISTQPYIYNKHLLTEKMDPAAYTEMRYNHRIRYLQSETVGTFKYLSVYVPLMDDDNQTYGYLNIPYLNSQIELNQEISGFLATLINLNAFIFLLAGAIAFFLTSRITASLSLIGETMQKVNLGAKNEVINWSRNDEIGVLVKEYNTMVQKLEASARSLAQSEREGAWREMARQVAHEIKNPLTPMKLSIQFLQKAIQDGAPNVKALSENMAKTLIEQIDQLTKIAGDFSQFANIGNARLEKFDVAEVIQSMMYLYSSNDKVQLYWEKAPAPCIIYADKVQINRLFTNLIQNAVEAGMEYSGEATIHIHQEIRNRWVIITLRDESGGIPESMKAHIFSPNFTTKSSGTGLGLAISRGIVEKANGHISYSSREGEGTTFTIELPLVNG